MSVLSVTSIVCFRLVSLLFELGANVLFPHAIIYNLAFSCKLIVK